MVIVKLSGGLGNQMFQYAFARGLAHRRGAQLKLDLSFFTNQPTDKNGHVFRNYDLDILNVQQDFATAAEVFSLSKRFKNNILDRICNKIIGRKKTYLIEPHFHFSTAAFNYPDNIYLEGYWQTEKYFADCQSLIRSDFTFKNQIGDEAKALLEKIKNTNSVCVNVRRGDFVTNTFHGSYGVDYFEKADNIINNRCLNHTYFIFSDEIEWCEENLEFDAPMVFVSHKLAGEKFQDYLRLMVACKHFVIPNSSFAWWAVWLNQNPDKIVIAPRVWFNDPGIDTKDLVPSDWIRI